MNGNSWSEQFDRMLLRLVDALDPESAREPEPPAPPPVAPSDPEPEGSAGNPGSPLPPLDPLPLPSASPPLAPAVAAPPPPAARSPLSGGLLSGSTYLPGAFLPFRQDVHPTFALAKPPLAPAAPAPPPSREFSSDLQTLSNAASGGSAAKPHALVLESGELNRKLLRIALERLGLTADFATGAEQALELHAQTSPAAVLLNTDDSALDAYRVAREIRKREGPIQRSAVYAITSATGWAARMLREQAGFDSYISVPLKLESVASVIGRSVPAARTQAAPLAPLVSIDPQVFYSLASLVGDQKTLSEAIALFVEGAPPLIAELRAAAGRLDAAQVTAIAHRLKGSSGQIGARAMQDTCVAIEALGRAGAAGSATQLIEDLAAAFERAREDLGKLSLEPLPPGLPQQAAPAGVFAPGSVLIAEDDALIARFLQHSLSNAGFEVVTVGDGEAAIEAIRRFSFQAVLLDINMPKRDGLAVLSELRLIPGKLATPVLILSARSQEHEIIRGLELGADDYVTKPFNPLEVVTRVRRLAEKNVSLPVLPR